MTDQVTICNLALDAIGARAEISRMDEGSTPARVLSLHWGPAVEAMLQVAHWNFARKQVALTVLKAASGLPENPTGAGAIPPQPWLYAYALPSDMVQARYVMSSLSSAQGTVAPGATLPVSGPPVRFMLSSDFDSNLNDQTVLLTNEPNAALVYTYRVTNTQLFDGQFVDGLANYLGARISNRVTGDKKLTIAARQLAMSIVNEARASNGNEGLTIIDNVPDWIRVRGYNADLAYPAGSMFWNPPASLSFIT